MIAHHTGALEMARTQLDDGVNTEMRDLAQTIVDAQQAEPNLVDLLSSMQAGARVGCASRHTQEVGMRSRTFATIALAATASIGFAGAAVAADGGRPYTVEMSGGQEAPGPGDPDGSGVATFRINPGKGTVCWTLEVSDIAPATAAHIHVAPAGDPGPVVVPLGAPTSGSSSGCADVTRELALNLIRNGEDYYVNVHNTEFPAGAVRGQLG